MTPKRSAVLAVLLLLGAIAMPLAAGESLRFPDSADFGVHADVAELLASIETRRTSTEIVQQTEGVLSEIREQPYARVSLIDSSGDSDDVRSVPWVGPARQEMVDTVLNEPLAGYTSLWDFLLNNPLEYYVYFKYGDGPGQWQEGSALNLRLLPTDLDWTYVDVDGDPGTGDVDGNDIRVRLKLEPREINIELAVALPPQTFNLDMFIGLAMQVENLNPGPGANDRVPLDVGVVKAASFDNRNYLVMLQFSFIERIPEHFSLSLLMNVYLSDLGYDTIMNLFNLDLTGIYESIDEAIEGPYVIEWGPSTVYAAFLIPNVLQPIINPILQAAGIDQPDTGERYPPEDLRNVGLMAGIGNVTNAGNDQYAWKEISWISADIMPDQMDSNGLLPGLGNLTLDTRSKNTAFDNITWFYPENNETFGGPTDIDVDYFDARENESFYAHVDIEDMPHRLQLRLRNESTNETTQSRLSMDSSSRLGRFNYTEYLYDLPPGPYPQEPDPDLEYRVMHLDIWGMPRHLSLRGTFDAGSASNVTISGGDLFTQLLNAAVGYFYKGFWGVGNTLRSISDRMFNMPSDRGWFRLNLMGDFLGGAEFWYTNDRYVYLRPEEGDEERDFFAFFRDLGHATETPLSGRIQGVGDTQLFFGNDTTVDLSLSGRRAFYFTFVDQDAVWNGGGGTGEDGTLKIESLPDVVNITVTDDSLDITTAGGQALGDVIFVGNINGTYMMLRMEDFPEALHLRHANGTFALDFEGTLGSLEIAITDNSLVKLPGRYVLLKRTADTTTVAARLTDISSVRYDTTNGTRFAYELGDKYPLYVSVNDSLTDTFIKAAVNPLPRSIDMTLTTDLGSGDIEVPSIGDISSIFDLSAVLVGVATMGDSVTNMLSNVTQGGVDILKDIGSNDRFDYLSTYNLNIVAEIEVGDTSLLAPVQWTHGVSMRRDEIAGETVIHARIFLNGLPKLLDIESRVHGKTTDITLDVEDFSSEFDWLLVDVNGLAGRDLFLFIDGIQNQTNLHIEMNITQEIMDNGLDRFLGTVAFVMTKSIGRIYLSTTRHGRPVTSLTLYASDPPMSGDLEYDVTNENHLTWEGEGGIPRLMLDIGKEVEGRWYHTHLVARDVPSALSLDVTADPDYDIDDPSPLQGLPTVEIVMSSPGASAMVSIDGHNIGQNGDLEIFAEGLGTLTRVFLSGGTLHVEGDIDTLLMRYSDLPLREEFQIDSLEIYAEDVEHLTVNIRMTVGALPVISVDARRSGDVRMDLDFEIDLMGGRDGKAVLIDISHDGWLPGVGTMGVNDISLEGGKEHLLVPDAISTVLLTLLG
ncbi:MAG: hypothetical protein L0Z54_06370 [Thermoplasmata archaeon]|nr:hypothetical protein [Thermoplasmata archaeon]